MLQILNTGRASAIDNMKRDEALLDHLDPYGEPILHLYEWENPSITHGYFIQPEKYLDLAQVQAHSLDLARRPTGGGIVFHIWDLAFSFLMPATHPAFSTNTLENYQFVNEAVLAAVQELVPDGHLIADNFAPTTADCAHFCMARPTQYDAVYQGRKIAGAAQRRRKQGYLHQGTISLRAPDPTLLKSVLKSDVLDAMLAHTYSFPNPPSQKLLTEKLISQISYRLYEQAKEKRNHTHSI